jgi:hypothetical protein
MTLLRLCAAIVGLCAAWQVVAATDYIFADSFETIVCNGVGCTYCSPTDPLPLCGSDSHCSPQVDHTSVCSYPAGSGTSGSTCSALADCAGPFSCVNTGISMTCQKWCAIPGGSCPATQTCIALNPSVYTDGTEWGICF